MDDAERLERMEDALSCLKELAVDHIILVEGMKDIDALTKLGIRGEFFCVQSGGGPVKAAEHAWRSGRGAVIMTDWDRRGGNLANSLRENLESLGVRYDDSVRRDLAVCCRPYSKDVESLDSTMGLLLSRTSNVFHPEDIQGRWAPS